MQPTRMALLSGFFALTTTGACAHLSTSPRVQNDLDRSCDPGTQICRLEKSAPVVATQNGQVIEGLRITVRNEPAILVRGLSDVVIRNVEIFHESGHGIVCENSPGLIIENVSIVHFGKRTNSAQENNIDCYRAEGLKVRNARLRGGSAGVYVLESPRVHLSHLEGFDFRGPDPRGQVVQFDKSPNCTLEDFSAINDPDVAWTADNVSIYFSDGCIVRRGLLEGNNGPWSVGIMFENSHNGLVEDVDTTAQGNGSFGVYPGTNVTFRRTRARENICGDQGRGMPVSNALVWSGSPESSGLRIEDSVYFDLCNPDNRVWDTGSFDTIQIAERDFIPRRTIKLELPWEGP
jgi:Right handed beta helix region